MSTRRSASDESLYRVPPYFYLHLLDQNTNVSRLEIGPQTFIRQDNERYDSQIIKSKIKNSIIHDLIVKAQLGDCFTHLDGILMGFLLIMAKNYFQSR